MHPCLSVDEILSHFAHELVASEAKGTAVALACCYRSFEEPVLDALWEAQERLTPLLKCIPQDVWEEEEGNFTFKRIPTKAEWAHSRKYARRMRTLRVVTSEDPISSDTLLALQLRTINDPWLPRLRRFNCEKATEAFTPFIPLFLSKKTTAITIGFANDPPVVVVATMISRFSTLCPDPERIILRDLPRDPAITEAVSEALLACNRDTLEVFCVDSPLTEEAREVVYRLPKLSDLWTVIQGTTSLPTLALPNLTTMDLEYDGDLNWLQGFRGATLKKLESIVFRTEVDDIGDFLEAFESVALTTSAKNTLSGFEICTSRPWNPNYSSLLLLNQLKKLDIEFSCKGGLFFKR